jgi:hypothetical protein
MGLAAFDSFAAAVGATASLLSVLGLLSTLILCRGQLPEARLAVLYEHVLELERIGYGDLENEFTE